MLLLLTSSLITTAQDYDWATFLSSTGSTMFQEVEDMVIDEAGNTYTLGVYSEPFKIDGDTIELHSHGRYSCYILKKNLSGETEWIHPFGSKSYDYAERIVYADGHIYASTFLQGDSVYHSNGAFSKSQSGIIIKFDTDGNYIAHREHNRNFRYESLEVVDTLIYASHSGQIDYYNLDLQRRGGLSFTGQSFIKVQDIVSVNDTAAIITGTFGSNITYQGSTITDTLSGPGYTAFLASVNTDGDLHWMYSYGRIYHKPILSYPRGSDRFYLAGNYTDDMAIGGFELGLTKFDGAHGFVARLKLQGDVEVCNVVSPTGSGGQLINEIVSNSKSVYIIGQTTYAGVNYNFGDTLSYNPDSFGYLFKLDANLNEEFGTAAGSVVRNGSAFHTATLVVGPSNRDNIIIGGRVLGEEAKLGCDIYEAKGHMVFRLIDADPDETPRASFYFARREKGNVRFFSSLRNKDYHYWDYGDGSPLDSAGINPNHQYARKGSIQVKLHAGNKCGETVVERQVDIKGIGEMYPNESPSHNLYIGQIKGVDFREGATFNLRTSDGIEKEIRNYQYVDSNTYNIMIEFEDNPLHTYDLYMENGSDKDTLRNALSIIESERPEIHVEVTGPKEVLDSRRYYFTMIIENKGNETAYGVPVTLAAPSGSEPKLGTRLQTTPEHQAWIDKMGGAFKFTYNQGYGPAEVATFLFPSLPGNSTYKIKFSAVVSQGNSIIKAVFDRPMYYGSNFFFDPEAIEAVQGDSIVCPDSRAISFMQDLFNVDELEPGNNIPNLGCVLYSWLIEQSAGIGGGGGFGGTPWGGGWPTGTFTGNMPLPQPGFQPWHLAPIILESISDANPDMPDENVIANYEKYVETFPGSTNDSGTEPSGDYEPAEIEYPTDILCVGNCDLKIIVIQEECDDVNPDGCKLPIVSKLIKEEDLIKDVGYADFLDQWEKALAKLARWRQCCEAEFQFTIKESKDPNEKYTASGYGDENHIRQNTNLNYHITFENVDTATAPASEVFVYDTLDLSVIDTTHFVWTSFGWSDYHISLDQKGTYVNKLVDTREWGGNIILEFEGKVDENGILSAVFTSLDTATMALTDNLYDGFLLPNINQPEGEGFFNFTVGQQPDLEHGTVIANQAKIVFDRNEPILTGQTINIIDEEAPVSSIIPFVKEVQHDSIIHVQFNGSDLGSGVHSYNVYIKKDDEPYALFFDDYEFEEIKIVANYGETYSFIITANDNVGHVEKKPLVAEATIRVEREATSINDIRDEQILVYPNPSYGDVNITGASGIHLIAYQIHDLSGRVIEKADFNDQSSNTILLNHVKAGIYLIDITTNRGTLTKKLIKN